MDSLNKYLLSQTNKTLLVIFTHPDDESFVTGGLLQVAKKLGYTTTLICLTCGEKGKNAIGGGDLKFIRPRELAKAVSILNVDKIILRDYPDSNLRSTSNVWCNDLINLITKIKPGIIATFDHSGITGHPDHISLSVEILKLIKVHFRDIALLWRTPNGMEKSFFNKCGTLDFAQLSTYDLYLTFSERLTKLKAIYAHTSQMKSLPFKFLIALWYLCVKYEPYYKVDPGKVYKHRFVPFKI